VSGHSLDELAERLAALEEAAASGGSSELETRLLAIETALRQLSNGNEDEGDLHEVRNACAELLERHVPAGERVMLAWQGDPAMLGVGGRPIMPFPPPREGLAQAGFEHGASAIAHLEAQRANGLRFLLVPEQGRRWLAELPQFEEHLSRSYGVIADEPGAGLLFDVGSPKGVRRSEQSLPGVLDRILDGERYAPVLDWTGFDLDSLIADRGIFEAPPDAESELPYLDDSIGVVVVDDPGDLDEARRVASSAVVLVDPDDAGAVGVAEVVEIGGAAPAPGQTIEVMTGRGALADARESDAEMVAVAEHGVLPLPGCLEAAEAILRRADDVGGVAVKVLDGDGALEGAGTTVFADGSHEGVGAGSLDVAAPWHEYVRPVCAATGILVARSEALRSVADDTDSLVEIAGRLWAGGHRILYQPDAWAVRALPAERPADVGAAGAWSDVLERRPRRPERLNVASWRWLLAHDDVEEAWR
jgi:antitoxin (DNA-binding transcriptional repressor) of toxin-antitoxin stability system